MYSATLTDRLIIADGHHSRIDGIPAKSVVLLSKHRRATARPDVPKEIRALARRCLEDGSRTRKYAASPPTPAQPAAAGPAPSALCPPGSDPLRRSTLDIPVWSHQRHGPPLRAPLHTYLIAPARSADVVCPLPFHASAARAILHWFTPDDRLSCSAARLQRSSLGAA